MYGFKYGNAEREQILHEHELRLDRALTNLSNAESDVKMFGRLVLEIKQEILALKEEIRVNNNVRKTN